MSLLFTDIVDSTLFAERAGDALAARTWQQHDRLARDLLRRHRGREIDRSDGFFLLFDELTDAALYALDYHQALAGLGLVARVGLHRGPTTLREASAEDVRLGAKPVEVEGLAKPYGARVMALARAGQTLLSSAAREALGESLAPRVQIESHGHYRLKGIEDPVHIYELGLRETCAFTPPPDADKAYRVVRAHDMWRPVREVRHNLPIERDAFVGRDAELRALARCLDAGGRMVTVTGPGGTGKTRLLRRYGRVWLGDWPGGVYFCDLSDAKSLDGIYFAVAGALEAPLGQGDPAVQLGHAIAARGRCLVILDNFEQVARHAPDTIGKWLDRAGEAAFVVTSRVRLHVSGEELFPVEPLPLDGAAIELFEARARAQVPGFALDSANRAAVAEVVRLLDGLPLAIELAAARISVLSAHQLVERLRDRFRLLAGSSGTSARQTTLKAAIDWSWNLLATWEQAALAQCSVFEGRFNLDAAEAVLDLSARPEAPPAMNAVQALIEKSLLRRWLPSTPGRFDADEPYFGMYLSIHEYAAQKLKASGPEAARTAEQRHGDHFARLGTDDALESLHRHGGVGRRKTLGSEFDNLVAACRRAVARGDARTAVGAYRAAWEVLDLRGPFAFGIDLGAEVFALGELPGELRDRALMTRGAAALSAGRVDEAQSWFQQTLEGARTRGDRQLESIVLWRFSSLRREQGRMQEALSLLDAALALNRQVGNRRMEGRIIGSIAILHSEQNRIEEARALFEEALAISREVGNRREEGSTIANLGMLQQHQARIEPARALYETALAIVREAGSRRDEGVSLSNLGILDQDQGRIPSARDHYEQALAIHRDMGNRREECIALGNLADLNHRQGRIEEARGQYEAALAIDREVGNRRHEAYIRESLGTLSLEQGELDLARTHLDQALSINRSVGSRRAEGLVLASLGELLCQQGLVAEARHRLAEGEALLRSAGLTQDLAKLLCVRGGVDIAADDEAAARAALAEAERVAHSMGAGPDSELMRKIEKLREALA